MSRRRHTRSRPKREMQIQKGKQREIDLLDSGLARVVVKRVGAPPVMELIRPTAEARNRIGDGRIELLCVVSHANDPGGEEVSLWMGARVGVPEEAHVNFS